MDEFESTSSSVSCSLSACSSPATCSDSFSAGDMNDNKRKSRINTCEEKRRMRNSRKRRKHSQQKHSKSDLRKALEEERSKNGLTLSKMELYMGMSRTYWERWQWELQKRKEAIIECKTTRRLYHVKKPTSGCTLPQIDPSMLVEVELPSKSDSSYVGRGSFGIVRVQKYRGILVAVKEYLPNTLSEDVLHEAKILVSLCHPYMPCLLGVCTSKKPLCLVMQFEGIIIEGVPKALTLLHLLRNGHTQVCNSMSGWILVCAQLMEALLYLHDTAEVLHNDIKSDNILITKTSSYSECQIVFVDFGKATTLSGAKRYHLSYNDQAEYTRKFLHVAPEVISGESKQSIYSDIFSIGGILYKIIEARKFDSDKRVCSTVEGLAKRCRSVHYYKRPRAKAALTCLQELVATP